MKNIMKIVIWFTGVCLLVLLFSWLSTATNRFIPYARGPFSMLSTTYANSEVDTIYFRRDDMTNSLTFGAHFKDSVSVTNAILRRMVGTELLPVIAGDTLTQFSALSVITAGNPSTSRAQNITLNPLPEQYIIIVTFAATNNGTTNGKVDWFMETQNNAR